VFEVTGDLGNLRGNHPDRSTESTNYLRLIPIVKHPLVQVWRGNSDPEVYSRLRDLRVELQ
jgi:hypothetical protein